MGETFEGERICYIEPFDAESSTVDYREPIVRCSDCKHWTEDEMEYYHYCGNWCEQVEPDGFCAWGERRDA